MLARYNPFATDRVERLLTFQPEWSGTTWEELEKKWVSQNYRATITGRHGTGKTCFLNTWATRLRHASKQAPIRIFLNTEQPKVTDSQWENLAHSQGKTIILDGEEQLGLHARMKFYRLTKNASSVLVTRHSQGKLPTLIHFNPDIHMLHKCIKKLAPDHYQQLSPQLPTLLSLIHI